MLGTDEVDDDYFTPVTSTSLANIFGNTSQDESKNDTLKYTPPKPQSASQKTEESKATICMFACALLAYEWTDNVYKAAGKLGYAILKFVKTGHHSMVLYDSTKSTLSSATISSNLNITLNDNHFISYYDDIKKYWSIYPSSTEINNIVDILRVLNVSIKFSDNKDSVCDPNKNNIEILSSMAHSKDTGSDTDSSLNRKTKELILSRMATMGHSVLPPQVKPADESSISSDADDNSSQPKLSRHKPSKITVKKSILEKNTTKVPASTSVPGDHTIFVPHTEHTVNDPSKYYSERGILPVNHSVISTRHFSHEGLDQFISEQRISNTEIRINVNRITDKVDHVMDKLNILEKKDNTLSNVQSEIVLKLLSEYENKIKVYENLLKSKGMLGTVQLGEVSEVSFLEKNKEVDALKTKISNLEHVNKELSDQQHEIKALQLKLNNDQINAEALQEKIKKLEETLNTRDVELSNLKTLKQELEAEIPNKIKLLMNNAYQAVAINFQSEEMYSGEKVKSIIGKIIKKVTINSFNEELINDNK